MPKFVWVCESIEKTELNKDIKDIRVDAIGIYDATDYPTESNHWLLAKTKNLLIVPTTDNSKLRRKKFSIFKCDQRTPTFQLNLKGTHTKWQG